MNHVFNTRIEATAALNRYCQPVFYRRDDATQLSMLLSDNPQIAVFDYVRAQLTELTKTRTPHTRLSSAELAERVSDRLGSASDSDYGVWVYYPWSNRLVHILDENEFTELRTNRNVYKITADEQQVLARRTIGIIGLSVGQSVAVTLAMERGFGELRIADFDAIELSNLNRIRAGIHDIGLPKVIAVAREIAEIDPFLKVKCFPEGLTAENMNDFFLEGGPLDLLIDECDGLDIKILARQKARELRIPVLMETSDRGMIDLERFDLEPDRPILHGLIEHLDTGNLRGLSNEEKVPYVLSIIGVDTMTDRMKASLLEVEQTIPTWPQLASDVVLGGATTANISRRLALDQLRVSGRFFVDMDALVSDSVPASRPPADTSAESDLVAAQASDHLTTTCGANVSCAVRHAGVGPGVAVDAGQAALDNATVAQLVEAAALAPSGGNIQPWRWRYTNKCISLYLDTTRVDSYLDFEQMGSYLSLGAATENLVLKAHEMHWEVAVESFPRNADPDLVAVFRFFPRDAAVDRTVEPHICDRLVATISHRLTNRNITQRTHIPAERLDSLRTIAQTVPGVQLEFMTGDRQLHDVGEIIARCDRLLLTDKQGHQGFVQEIRWTRDEALRTRDGVDVATIDLTAAEAAGFEVAKRWWVVEHLARWGGGTVFEKLSRKTVAAASAVGLITMPEYGAANYFQGGRALQRLWLQAHQHGICLQPMSVGVFLFARLLHGGAPQMTSAMRNELSELRQQFLELFHTAAGRQDLFLFRLFEGGPPKVRSLRRPVADILTME